MLRLAAGILLVIVGSVWILQGFDVTFAPQSFMTGDRSWALWGALAVIGGGVLIRAHVKSN
jgi:hypothetical protein